MATKDPLLNRIRSGVERLGISVEDARPELQCQLLRLLEKWSKTYNLTAIRDPQAMVGLHILDSLSISADLVGERIIDVATGAGFPGLPLAIMQPERQFTLLDSSAKKLRFVQQAAQELGLANVTACHARVPDYAPEVGFDTVTARAFAKIDQIVADCGHLVAKGGRIVAMKGRDPAEELIETNTDWGHRIRKLTVPGVDQERHVVIIKRT